MLKTFIKKLHKIFESHFLLKTKKYPLIFYVIKWVFLTSLVGLGAGCASAIFLLSLEFVTQFRENNSMIIIFLPFIGFAIGLLYYRFGNNIAGGNNLLIETIQNPKERIPFKMAPMVYLGTIATHLFGGSAGREGTALQMSGSIADTLSKPFNLSKDDRRILIISAIAAGFGSVFGTPFAGAIFALEVAMIGKIKYNAIFPALLSAIIANYVTNLWNVDHTHYFIHSIPKISLVSILHSIFAGVLFGIGAILFCKLLQKTGAFFNSKISFAPLRPFFGGIIILLLTFILGSTKYLGLGVPLISEAFIHSASNYDFVLKIIFTVITLGSGFKGGEVTPLFFIGATLGSALSLYIPLPVSLLAGMGFVAVFAGATNTPFACIIMALELFGIECAIYVTIACFVSYWVSGNSTIYSSQKREL